MRRVLLAATAIAVIGVAAAAAFSGVLNVNNDDGTNIIISHSDDGSGVFVFERGGLELTAKWNGDFDFAADGRSLSDLDGRLEIERKEAGRQSRVVFTGNGKAIKTKYFVGDRERAVDEAAETEIGDLVLAFARASGIEADDRVAALLNSGGPDAVLAEIDELPADHPAMKYLVAFAEQARLDAAQIARAAERIGVIEGDHDKRLSLEAFFTHQRLSGDSRAVLLSAAEGIEGDHDMRLLLEAVAEGEMTPASVYTSLILLARIEGDHDTRLAAEALLENESFSDEDAARLLAIATTQIEGDHDMRLLIEAGSERIGRSDAIAAASIRALNIIESDHDKRLAIENVASMLPKQSSRWVSLIEAAARIDSDHDSRLALEALAGFMPADQALLDAYRQAAARIGSDHDREQALAAVEGR